MFEKIKNTKEKFQRKTPRRFTQVATKRISITSRNTRPHNPTKACNLRTKRAPTKKKLLKLRSPSNLLLCRARLLNTRIKVEPLKVRLSKVQFRWKNNKSLKSLVPFSLSSHHKWIKDQNRVPRSKYLFNTTARMKRCRVNLMMRETKHKKRKRKRKFRTIQISLIKTS